MPGVGAMLHALGGGSEKDPKDYYGRKITAAAKDGDDFRLTFDDGVTIEISDAGQSCCEHRYVVMDDDPSVLVGHRLVAIEVNRTEDAPSEDTHEVAFLDVKSDGGMVSFSFHNEHNGYYGGFGLNVAEVSAG